MYTPSPTGIQSTLHTAILWVSPGWPWRANLQVYCPGNSTFKVDSKIDYDHHYDTERQLQVSGYKRAQAIVFIVSIFCLLIAGAGYIRPFLL